MNACARCGRETYAAAPVRTLCLGCVAADRAAWIDGRAVPVHATRPGLERRAAPALEAPAVAAPAAEGAAVDGAEVEAASERARTRPGRCKASDSPFW